MKTLFLILLLVANMVYASDNAEYQKVIDNFTKAVSIGDKQFLEENVHPTAIWSAPFQKLLRGRTEIMEKHRGIAEGHSIKTSKLEFTSEGNMLQVFGFFDYLQQSKSTHSGRFSAVFQANREKLWQLTHGLWHLDGSHLKSNSCQEEGQTCSQ